MAGFDAREIRRLAVSLGAKAAAVRPEVQTILAKTSADIERDAKINAPVDTGALRNSIGRDLAPGTAVIGPTVNYGAYVELGTSRMRPQPYLGPATDRHEPAFYAALATLAGGLP